MSQTDDEFSALLDDLKQLILSGFESIAASFERIEDRVDRLEARLDDLQSAGFFYER